MVAPKKTKPQDSDNDSNSDPETGSQEESESESEPGSEAGSETGSAPASEAGSDESGSEEDSDSEEHSEDEAPSKKKPSKGGQSEDESEDSGEETAVESGSESESESESRSGKKLAGAKSIAAAKNTKSSSGKKSGVADDSVDSAEDSGDDGKNSKLNSAQKTHANLPVRVLAAQVSPDSPMDTSEDGGPSKPSKKGKQKRTSRSPPNQEDEDGDGTGTDSDEGEEPEPSETTYILLNGTLTGDIWHVAALQILFQAAKKKAKKDGVDDFPLSTVVAIRTMVCVYAYEPDKKNKKDESDCPQKGRVSYNYLKDLGLYPGVIRLKEAESADGKKTSTHINNMWALTAAHIDNQMPGRGRQKSNDFDTLLAAQKAFEGTASEEVLDGSPRIITLYQCTSAMMSLADYLGLEQSIKILQTALCLDISKNQQLNDKVNKKFDQLKEVIGKAKNDKVLLVNFRLAGSVNKQHNTNTDQIDAIRTEAAKQGMSIVLVLGSAVKTEKVDDPYFVMFDDSSLEDKRYAASLWTQVAQKLLYSSAQTNDKDRRVFGLLGGRSGGVDIASFVGVRCCSWDEPPFFAPKEKRLVGKAFSIQMPQHARLLTQRKFTSVVYLSLTPGTKRKNDPRKGFQGDLLQLWLEGKEPSEDLPGPIPPYKQNLDVLNRYTKIGKFKIGGTSGQSKNRIGKHVDPIIETDFFDNFLQKYRDILENAPALAKSEIYEEPKDPEDPTKRKKADGDDDDDDDGDDSPARKRSRSKSTVRGGGSGSRARRGKTAPSPLGRGGGASSVAGSSTS